MILADGNKCAAQAANIRGCHNTTLFHIVIQKCQCCRCAGCACFLQTHFLEDFRNAVPNCRGRCQRKVNDTKRCIQSLCRFLRNQLTHTGNLEGCPLYGFAYGFKVSPSDLLQRTFYHAGAADTDIDTAVCLPNAMECACHKGVVLHCITKYNQLRTADTFVVLRAFRCFHNNLAHLLHCVHIQPVSGSPDIHRSTDSFCHCQCLRNGINQDFITFGIALLHQRGKATDEVYANLLCCLVQCLSNAHIGIRIFAACRRNRDGCYGNSLVHHGHTVFLRQLIPNLHQILCVGCDFFVYLFIKFIDICICAIQQTNAHRNGSDIQIHVRNHAVGFQNFIPCNHSRSLP